MAMSVDQTRKERALFQIDGPAGVARSDFGEFSNIDNAIAADGDRAIVEGRSLHR